jgi:hypothetical protein
MTAPSARDGTQTAETWKQPQHMRSAYQCGMAGTTERTPPLDRVGLPLWGSASFWETTSLNPFSSFEERMEASDVCSRRPRQDIEVIHEELSAFFGGKFCE